MSLVLCSEVVYPWWDKIGFPLADHIWQSSLFAVMAGLLTLLLSKNRASTRYAIWLFASLKFVIPFSLLIVMGSHFQSVRSSTSPVFKGYKLVQSLNEPFAAATAPSQVANTRTQVEKLFARTSPTLLVLFWGVGFVSVLSFWSFRVRGISVVSRKAKTVTEGREFLILNRARQATGQNRQIRLALSSSSIEPGIFGFIHPVLILPTGISERLTDEQMEAIMVHELCHARRHDNLAAALHMFVEAIFWFHPLTWWVGKGLLDERERACDEEVLQLGVDPQGYAESILKICEFYVQSPLLCTSGVTGSSLKKRIEVIMQNRTPLQLSFPRKLILGCVSAFAITIPFAYGVFRPLQTHAQTIIPAFNLDTDLPTSPFKSVSIRLDRESQGMLSFGWFTPEMFSTRGATLRDLIGEAYYLQSGQILNGSEWTNSDRYDIRARFTESEANKVQSLNQDNQTPECLKTLQLLMNDRFKLVLHRETRLVPTYVLRVIEGGPKLHPATPGDTYPNGMKDMYGKGHGGMVSFGDGKLVFQGVPIASLVKLLTTEPQHMDRIIADNTGLSGNFDFAMDWPPPSSGGGPSPALVKAMEDQLGLTLQASNSVIPIVVVDHAEQPPLD
jgi:bla regulator protein blaR1